MELEEEGLNRQTSIVNFSFLLPLSNIVSFIKYLFFFMTVENTVNLNTMSDKKKLPLH